MTIDPNTFIDVWAPPCGGIKITPVDYANAGIQYQVELAEPVISGVSLPDISGGMITVNPGQGNSLRFGWQAREDGDCNVLLQAYPTMNIDPITLGAGGQGGVTVAGSQGVKVIGGPNYTVGFQEPLVSAVQVETSGVVGSLGAITFQEGANSTSALTGTTGASTFGNKIISINLNTNIDPLTFPLAVKNGFQSLTNTITASTGNNRLSLDVVAQNLAPQITSPTGTVQVGGANGFLHLDVIPGALNIPTVTVGQGAGITVTGGPAYTVAFANPVVETISGNQSTITDEAGHVIPYAGLGISVSAPTFLADGNKSITIGLTGSDSVVSKADLQSLIATDPENPGIIITPPQANSSEPIVVGVVTGYFATESQLSTLQGNLTSDIQSISNEIADLESQIEACCVGIE